MLAYAIRRRRTRSSWGGQVVKVRGSVAMVAEAGERAKGEVAGGRGRREEAVQTHETTTERKRPRYRMLA